MYYIKEKKITRNYQTKSVLIASNGKYLKFTGVRQTHEEL